jgi:hypothetical protein
MKKSRKKYEIFFIYKQILDAFKKNIKVNIQSFMISMEIMGTGLIYIYFYNFYVPDFCFALAHILWQLTHGNVKDFLA